MSAPGYKSEMAVAVDASSNGYVAFHSSCKSGVGISIARLGAAGGGWQVNQNVSGCLMERVKELAMTGSGERSLLVGVWLLDKGISYLNSTDGKNWQMGTVTPDPKVAGVDIAWWNNRIYLVTKLDGPVGISSTRGGPTPTAFPTPGVTTVPQPSSTPKIEATPTPGLSPTYTAFPKLTLSPAPTPGCQQLVQPLIGFFNLLLKLVNLPPITAVEFCRAYNPH
jgi:hypothetical protein